jgi:hypothetical protein
VSSRESQPLDPNDRLVEATIADVERYVVTMGQAFGYRVTPLKDHQLRYFPSMFFAPFLIEHINTIRPK